MFCTSCGKPIEEDSRFCRHCGARQKAGEAAQPLPTPPEDSDGIETGKDATAKRILLGGGGAFLVLFIAALAIRAGNHPDGAKPDSVEANAAMYEAAADALTASTKSEPGTAPTPAANWTYEATEDKLRGGVTRYATTTSINSIRQDSPYSDATTMDITVRKSPAHGTDVLLTISSGQMMCPSYEGCSGTVRFDNGPAQPIRFNGPSDNSSETVFVEDAAAFLAKLQRSKRVVIEKTLYQAGSPQFEFNTAGLAWQR